MIITHGNDHAFVHMIKLMSTYDVCEKLYLF